MIIESVEELKCFMDKQNAKMLERGEEINNDSMLETSQGIDAQLELVKSSSAVTMIMFLDRTDTFLTDVDDATIELKALRLDIRDSTPRVINREEWLAISNENI